MGRNSKRSSYWQSNTKLIGILIAIWAVFALLFSIVLVEPLNQLGSLGKLPLGFWIAQQGSIYVFVALIFVYAVQMDRLDRQYGNAPERGETEDTDREVGS
ncbi:MAG: DUF4212 domain-containing protein [Cyanobacteria bacterium P01_F01_bin.42]